MIYKECGHQFPGLEASVMPKRCPSCHPSGRSSAGKSALSPKKARPDLEGMLMTQLTQVGIKQAEDEYDTTGYLRQYRFHHKRKWLFDFAWPDIKLAIEVHGGTYVPRSKTGKVLPGAHSRGAHQRRDFEKWSYAAMDRWVILHFDTKDVTKRVAIARVIQALRKLCPSRISHIE